MIVIDDNYFDYNSHRGAFHNFSLKFISMVFFIEIYIHVWAVLFKIVGRGGLETVSPAPPPPMMNYIVPHPTPIANACTMHWEYFA